MSAALFTHPLFAGFTGAFEFIFSKQDSSVTGGKKVGGIEQVLELAWTQVEVSVLALAVALLIALPLGLYFGHKGAGELLAVGLGNAGRAVPELALIAFVAAMIGVGIVPLTGALAVLGIPPILTNTFVGVRQVDRAAVDAARGIGMTELETMRKVELPLAVPSIMTGVRGATVNIVATATIAPLVGVVTLGDFILGENVYGVDGVVAGAICTAILALLFEFALAGLQRRLTSKGLRLQAR
ncbi:MAG TPA: ABC transporter permease [Solirubrobacterales bacterium]|nr:ABC transporter permease [Solirubrobacterales bacterium]HVY97384.1 ABC transporter permease [Solirubrobacterales bacterium]